MFVQLEAIGLVEGTAILLVEVLSRTFRNEFWFELNRFDLCFGCCWGGVVTSKKKCISDQLNLGWAGGFEYKILQGATSHETSSSVVD